MDVHTATISVAVRDAAGKLIMESVIETKSSTILQFIQGLRGDLYVTFEEGTWAAWLYGLRRVKELSRAYLTIGKDLTRVMNRVKAIYRGWGIPCAGKSVYHPRHREEWLRKITQASVRRRAELYYEQLDVLVVLRKQARQELLAESKKHKAWKLLRSIPALGPIRVAVLMAIVQTPHRFRAKRPLWKYSGFGVVTHTSADHRYVNGQL